MQPIAHRKPRFRRILDPKPLLLTKRDIGILEIVARYRLIQSHQLFRLVKGSHQNLLRRLARLFHSGLVDRPRAQIRIAMDAGSASLAYSLTKSGQRMLREYHKGDVLNIAFNAPGSFASAVAIPHALEVAEVLSRLESAAAEQNRTFVHPPTYQSEEGSYLLQSWRIPVTENRERNTLTVIPDAIFTLSVNEESERPAYFLLEVDRGTMPLKRSRLLLSSVYRKLLAYRETRKSGNLAQEFGIHGFRVLLYFESSARAASAAKLCLELHQGDSSMFLFATASKILDDKASPLDEWTTSKGIPISL